MCGELSSECGASFLWGEFSLGRVVLGRVVFGASCPYPPLASHTKFVPIERFRLKAGTRLTAPSGVLLNYEMGNFWRKGATWVCFWRNGQCLGEMCMFHRSITYEPLSIYIV